MFCIVFLLLLLMIRKLLMQFHAIWDTRYNLKRFIILKMVICIEFNYAIRGLLCDLLEWEARPPEVIVI